MPHISKPVLPLSAWMKGQTEVTHPSDGSVLQLANQLMAQMELARQMQPPTIYWVQSIDTVTIEEIEGEKNMLYLPTQNRSPTNISDRVRADFYNTAAILVQFGTMTKIDLPNQIFSSC